MDILYIIIVVPFLIIAVLFLVAFFVFTINEFMRNRSINTNKSTRRKSKEN